MAFGQNLESACKAHWFREWNRLRNLSDTACEQALRFPVGSDDWKTHAVEFGRLCRLIQEHEDQRALIG